MKNTIADTALGQIEIVCAETRKRVTVFVANEHLNGCGPLRV